MNFYVCFNEKEKERGPYQEKEKAVEQAICGIGMTAFRRNMMGDKIVVERMIDNTNFVRAFFNGKVVAKVSLINSNSGRFIDSAYVIERD